eukprot:CAMPEP_0117614444 /NCGR_PEP_ID=MMETSP0784-20121206/84042_1 /TAXON_ID=39447 /ORGANISM="" /LENGTH=38 /DNA_ID= /DNA_START= /DNA_END= /DNA_ORIENTATION=
MGSSATGAGAGVGVAFVARFLFEGPFFLPPLSIETTKA